MFEGSVKVVRRLFEGRLKVVLWWFEGNLSSWTLSLAPGLPPGGLNLPTGEVFKLY